MRLPLLELREDAEEEDELLERDLLSLLSTFLSLGAASLSFALPLRAPLPRLPLRLLLLLLLRLPLLLLLCELLEPDLDLDLDSLAILMLCCAIDLATSGRNCTRFG